jgi:hypothetical protein
LGAPIWIGDSRVAVASSASINKATVTYNRGEMSFQMFDVDDEVRSLLKSTSVGTDVRWKLRAKIGNTALPEFLIKYIERTSPNGKDSVVVHPPSDISGQTSAGTDVENVARQKGFMGKSQLNEDKFPKVSHHLKVFHNSKNKGRVFYKLRGVHFIHNN